MKNIPSFFIYIILICLILLLNELSQEMLNFDKLFYNSLSEKLTSQQIEKFLGYQRKWQWLVYIVIPIFYLIKITIITTVLYIGLYFSNKDFKFANIWAVVLQAEFIFLLVPIFKIVWFSFFQTNYNLEDVQSFYPLSLLNITGYEDLETWFKYPFQVLNLFEFCYIFFLAFQIGKLTYTNTDNGLKIVLSSYVPLLSLWIVTIMFFTLNYS